MLDHVSYFTPATTILWFFYGLRPRFCFGVDDEWEPLPVTQLLKISEVEGKRLDTGDCVGL